MRNTGSQADSDELSSLYDQIVDATGIEFDPVEFKGGAEEYKNNLVRHFGHMPPEEFDVLSEELRDWINEATLVFNANRRAKDRSPLPDIEGMPEPPPPTKARSSRVMFEEDEDEDESPPPPRRLRVAAAPPPEDEDEPDDDPDDGEPEPEEEPEEEAAAPPPRVARGARTRARGSATPAKPPARVARGVAAEPARTRDPDAGRYAKVMPHYLKDRTIEIEELQEKIEKTDGAGYSPTTLDRTLAACRSVVAWAEHNGVDFSPALRR
jgi:hypothetical protein